MHINETKYNFICALRVISSILPTLFWGSLILGFEGAYMAFTSLLCALIHEMGHISYLMLFSKSSHSIKSAIFGLKIKAVNVLSYKDELLLYISGPLANLLFGLVFLLHGGVFFISFAIINFATAISNLIPVEGYDGYGIVRVILERRFPDGRYLNLLCTISTVIIFLFCILSIYLIDRYGGGYWIFAVFFVQMIKHFQKNLK